MTDPLHPDHLQRGHMVGPWHIVQTLGRGGFSRVFKVERDGCPYSMKMALHPLTQFKQALTDLHPFNPELPDKELLAAIAIVPPTAPHLLNPLAPRPLSDIAMKLLEKNPEARYPGTQALLQALEEAAGQERKSPAWRVPLTAPEGPPEASLEDAEVRVAQHQRAPPEGQAARAVENAPSRDGAQQGGLLPRRAALGGGGGSPPCWRACSSLEPSVCSPDELRSRPHSRRRQVRPPLPREEPRP